MLSALLSAAAYTVTSAADSGSGTLRDAITQSNATSGANTIDFAIADPITLATSLPTITTQLSIDGAGTVVIDGGGVAETGFLAQAPTTITGLTILNFDVGVDLESINSTVESTTITGCSEYAIVADADQTGVSSCSLTGNFGGVFAETGRHVVIAQSTIANNMLGIAVGVDVTNDPSEVEIFGNSIYDNGDAGIDGDVYPDRAVVASATIAATTIELAGTLTSDPSASYDVQVFDNPTCDASGAGEGETFLGALTAQTGPFDFEVNAGGVVEGDAITTTVTNLTQRATSAFSTCVIACPVIALAPAQLAITLDRPVDTTITASGGIAAYTFALGSGALPAGLALDGSGQLTGTPTTAGSAAFSIRATDADGCTATIDYDVSPACPSIGVGPGAFDIAEVGEPFDAQLTAQGGSAPYAFVVLDLPAGLAVGSDAMLSGTPSQAGSYSLGITATDANGCTGFGTPTLIVDAMSPIDAGVSADAPPTENETGSSSGCGCRSSNPSGVLLVLIGFVLIRPRLRRRGS
ncbi:MAG TPA: putative Ig domain-containing protein [Kofleriaceae bacterium]|jgi:hypothetical protein